MTSDRDDHSLHDLGGNIGPASIRGSGATPGGRPGDDAEPRSGRVTGPVDSEQPRGVIDDDADLDAPAPGSTASQDEASGVEAGGHGTADGDWVDSDEDDPDGGSGRTDARPGYLEDAPPADAGVRAPAPDQD